MTVSLRQNNYGKQRVRVVRVIRDGDLQQVRDITVGIRFEGDFETAHVSGDNRCILPTDTMKNTVYAMAGQADPGALEDFGRRLARHFLTENAQLWRVTIDLVEDGWARLPVGGPDGHPHAFMAIGGEQQTATVVASRDQVKTLSGLRGLTVMKTSDSGFIGFSKDEFTTLPEVTDRIFKTSIDAEWTCLPPTVPYAALRQGVRRAMLEVFARHDSLSVQQTLYAMAEAALSQYADLAEITLRLPNRHCIPFDLRPFGMENRNEVFVATDEPHGQIEATIGRS